VSSEVEAPGSFAPLNHKAGIFEHTEVLRDCRPSHIEVRCDLAGRPFLGCDEREDLATPGFSDSADNCVHACYISRYLRKCQLTVLANAPPSTVWAPIPHESPLPRGPARAHHGVMTEITRWQDPAARRGVHQFVPGRPEPPRSNHVSRTSAGTSDGVGRALEDWMEGLTVASTVDAD